MLLHIDLRRYQQHVPIFVDNSSMIYVYLCNVRAQTYAYSDLRFTCFTHAHIYICAYVCVRIPSMYLHNLHIQTTDEHIQTKTYSIRCIYISIRYVHTHRGTWVFRLFIEQAVADMHWYTAWGTKALDRGGQRLRLSMVK